MTPGFSLETVLEALDQAEFVFVVWRRITSDPEKPTFVVEYVNKSGAFPSPKPRDSLLGLSVGDIFPRQTANEIDHGLSNALETRSATESTMAVNFGDGEQVFRSVHYPVGNGMVISVVTEETRERRVERNLYFDRRTGLSTRAHFDDTLSELISTRRDKPMPLGVLFLDLDKFKSINDTYGHIAGDEILSLFANRLREISPDPLAISRWGGDEFAIITVWDQRTNVQWAERFLEALRTPFRIDGAKIVVRSSVGVASLEPTLRTDARALMLAVDRAMYRAKAKGGGIVVEAQPLDFEISPATVEGH